jgi:hypothetical protein
LAGDTPVKSRAYKSVDELKPLTGGGKGEFDMRAVTKAGRATQNSDKHLRLIRKEVGRREGYVFA